MGQQLIQTSLEIVKHDISSSTIVGTSCAILVLLFLIQPLGTTKIRWLFCSRCHHLADFQPCLRHLRLSPRLVSYKHLLIVSDRTLYITIIPF